jgi:nitrogen fixation/metabolism regulation signal transduction histidine kinase
MDPTTVPRPSQQHRTISRALRWSLMASVAMAGLLLAVLATASSNTELFQSHYPVLLWASAGVAVALFVLVVTLVVQLVQRYRRGLFGTRLMVRMASIFVLMTVIPVALVFVVAVQFIGRSIESWFDIPVEQALESGLALGRATLDTQLNDLTLSARAMAINLADITSASSSTFGSSSLSTSSSSSQQLQQALNRLREQAGAQDALVVNSASRVLASSGGQLARLLPDPPPSTALRQARITRLFSAVDSSERGLLLRVVVPIGNESSRAEDQRYLQLLQQVPPSLAANAEAVQQGYEGYKAISASRNDLKRLYRLTLSLIFLLTLFSAVAAAFLLAGWLTGPLSDLASATRSVAEGDFRPLKDYAARGELGVLTRSFNAMTRQLQDARELVDRNQRELEQANARLESVLSNLNAGVLVLNSDMQLTLANPGADRILGARLNAMLGQALERLPGIGELAREIRTAFNEEIGVGQSSWQRQFKLQGDAEQTILARGSILPERRVGYVLVFDDITAVQSAQRAVAWSEVAQRLAHEIKNPLTPIQLAAERLQVKLHDKLAQTDGEFLARNAKTIINQVDALKLMVDEFRHYARLPSATLESIELNDLVDEVMGLYGGVSSARLQVYLAPRLPAIEGDRAQLRQVVHNLIKNALEAIEGREGAQILVGTERVVLPDGAQAARLVIRDNGEGFGPKVMSRAFEPYITSKTKGTGLGLAIVKKILDEHHARIDLANVQNTENQILGAQVAVLFTKLGKSVDNRTLAPNSA